MSEVAPLIIDGQRVVSEATFGVTNPATGEEIQQVSDVSSEQAQAALEAAARTFPGWSMTPLSERREIIVRYADILERERERLLDLLIAETGKPYDNAEYDFGMLTTCLRFFVEEAARVKQEVIPDPDGRFHHYILRQPLGVVVGFLAWNFPLLNLGYKLGPVLAAGCTAVIKPSRLTPLASLAAAELAAEAGIPPGVINLIAGQDYAATECLLTSDTPSMVTMIGSTEAGVQVMRTAATSIKHYSLELGGNAPVVVYPDADIENAAHQVIDLKLANCGQVCVSPNRCFVHASVVDQFTQLAVTRAGEFHLGAGKGPEPRMGPMLTAEARQRVLSWIHEAVDQGARIACGGRIPNEPNRGYFLEPTVLTGVRPDMRVACDEIFGPVLPIISFSDEDDVPALANDTRHGLAAYVFTGSLERGLQAAESIQAGSVCVNEPHYAVHLPHGGLKQSGIGKDCSHYSIEEYLTVKRVSIRMR